MMHRPPLATTDVPRSRDDPEDRLRELLLLSAQRQAAGRYRPIGFCCATMYVAPKELYKSAQGNALGTGSRAPAALKGRNKLAGAAVVAPFQATP